MYLSIYLSIYLPCMLYLAARLLYQLVSFSWVRPTSSSSLNKEKPNTLHRTLHVVQVTLCTFVDLSRLRGLIIFVNNALLFPR